MRKVLLNLLPALAASTPSLFAVVMAALVIANSLSGTNNLSGANNLSGFARVRIPSAG